MKQPFVIAEIGVNHNGSIEQAKKLILGAKDAGANAVKFQTFDLEELLSDKAVTSNYQIKNLGEPKSQSEILQNYILSNDDYIELIDFCDNIQIEFLSTPFGLKSAEFLKNLGLGKVKISSGDLTNFPLIRLASTLFPEVILSTGMATMQEVREAVDNIFDGCTYSLLHCVSSYPAPIDQCNLRVIADMRNEFQCNVGWSGGTIGNLSSILALSQGAVIFEKHITINKNDEGPDHSSSMELSEFKEYVNVLKTALLCLGSKTKSAQPCELEAKANARRSLAFNKDLLAGHMLRATDLTLLRPGTGLPYSNLEKLVGRYLQKDVKSNQLIEFSHLKVI